MGIKLELLSILLGLTYGIVPRIVSKKNTWSDLYFWYMVNRQTDIG